MGPFLDQLDYDRSHRKCPPVSQVKLFYFDLAGKGESIRIACAWAGVPLEDVRIPLDDRRLFEQVRTVALSLVCSFPNHASLWLAPSPRCGRWPWPKSHASNGTLTLVPSRPVPSGPVPSGPAPPYPTPFGDDE